MKYYRQLDLDFRGTFYRPDKPTLLYFLFFPTAHFFISILCLPTFGTFGFAANTLPDPKGKTKRAKSPTRLFFDYLCD
jgi:hypothetical protein